METVTILALCGMFVWCTCFGSASPAKAPARKDFPGSRPNPRPQPELHPAINMNGVGGIGINTGVVYHT